MQRLLADAEKFSGVHYDINNLNDVYSAIHVVQEELGVTGTTAEEASQTLAGSFSSMQSAWQNMLGSLATGENVSESMSNLLETVSTFLFDNLIPTIGNVLKSIPGAVKEFFTGGGAAELASSALDLLKSIGKGIVENAPVIFEFLNEALTTALTSLTEWNPLETSTAGESIMSKIGEAIKTYGPVVIKALGTIMLKLSAATGLAIVKLLAKLLSMLLRGIVKLIKTVGAKAKSLAAKAAKTAMNALLKPIKAIKGKISEVFEAVKSRVAKIWKKIKEKITKPIEEAKEKVDGIVEKIKGFFPLSVGKIFSNIKLPHFSISGKAPFGLGGKGEKPSVSVSWYAKAMDTPYMFQNATLFGAGETGDEIIYGRAALMRDIEAAAGGRSVSINNNITVNGAEDPEVFADRFVRRMNMQLRTV